MARKILEITQLGGGGGGDRGCGNLGESLREAEKERAGNGILKVAETGRNRKNCAALRKISQ